MVEDRKLAVLRAIVEDYVSTQEPVGSKALVERHALGVSPATVRNDMAALEEEGFIAQPHTSAGRVPTEKGYRLFVDRLTTLKPMSAAEKRAIGAAMAERVLEGQTIILDSGSTTLEVARHLTHSRLTVVTHDLRVGLEIASKPSIHLVFIGGELLPSGLAMWGPTSVQQIETMRVNVAIFGADTVTDDGIFSTSSYETELKRKMRSVAGEAFFVADSSKFGREALFRVFGFDEFTAGITDATLDPIRAARFPVPIIRAPLPAQPGPPRTPGLTGPSPRRVLSR